MKYIIYISNSTNSLKEHELQQMLREFSAKNLEHEITGALLYFDGSFIELLEGTEVNIDKVFKAIETDERHKSIIKIFDEPLRKRNFNDWSMAFLSSDPDIAAKLPGYASYDALINHRGNHRAVIALKTFINTHKISSKQKVGV